MKSRVVRHSLVALLAIVASAAQLQAQTGGVRGRVVDAAQLGPLTEATVTVAGKTVLSGPGGFFSVDGVPAGVHTLRATLIGYRPFEVEISVLADQATSVDVLMEVAPFEMETLVAVGYGEQQTRDLTGVVTEVSSEAFNTGRIVSPEELIQAKVAGVQVTEDNGSEPGGGISIRIRGGTSVNASNEPLYVIDGVVIPVGGGLSAGRNPLNFLNPADIKSFTVLKDASATAIYGAQGANGVILIETTAGRRLAGEGATVTYRGSVSGQGVTAGPDVMNASEFRDAVAAQAPEKLALLGDVDTDWRDAVQQNGFGQDHSVAVAVGGEKMDFRVSLGYLNQEGVVRASEAERATINLAYNQLLFDDAFRVWANVLGARNEDRFTPGGVLGNSSNFAPTQPILDPNSIYGGYFEWDDALAANNPVGELNLVRDQGTTYRSLGIVGGEYALPWVEGLSATGRFSYLVTNSERRTFSPSNSRQQAETGLNGTISRSNPSEFGWGVDGYVTYARTWGEHGLNATGGYAYQETNNNSPSFFAQQLSSDLLGLDGIPTAELERTFLTVEESKSASWFARANYSFRERYLFTATVRTDGASVFGEGNQWATFPSFAGAWRISDEQFMEGTEWLSDLKLRVSWGKGGNSAIGNYLQFKDYVFGDPLVRAQFGDEFVSTIRPSAADPNIKWEETSSWNFGLDYGLADNRYRGSIEVYTKTTDDLLFSVPVAAGTNLSNFVTTNIGTVKNTGVEFTLNAVLLEGSGDGLTWDANFNFAYTKNELREINPFAGGVQQIRVGGISGGVGSTIQILRPGEPINSFFVYEHIRDDAGNPIYQDMNGVDIIDDQDLYVDQNGDGIVNQDDFRVFNSPAPDWTIGHTSLLSYKKWDLSFTLLAQIGNHVYNNVASTRGFYDNLRDSQAPNNLHRSVLETQFQRPQYFSDEYVEDASFLRLNNIEVGYTFDRALNGIRAYGTVQNVFTITGYSGIDPTAGINGIDNNIYPRSRTFTAGLSVQF